MAIQRETGAGGRPAAGGAAAPSFSGGPLRGLGRFCLGLVGVGLGATAITLGGSATLAHVLTRPRDLRRVPRRTIDDSVLPVRFRTDDGLAIEGWYLAHPDARDAIVICHGFAMNRHELLDIAQGLRARGHAVLLFDFRAHGTSEGLRSTIGLRETREIAAAVDFLESRPELAGRPVGVAGISMGAAAALLTAERIRAHRPIDALAAIAPRPILLIHDETDRLIPVAHTHALFAAASGPKECWITACLGHASLWAHRADEYVARLDDFFSRALAKAVSVAA
jgi:alpha-beta hydrolase superfamily lysophospholipase